MHRTTKLEHCVSRNSGDRTRTGAKLTWDTNYRGLPVMITRLIISLRDAALSRGPLWGTGEPTAIRGHGRGTFVPMGGALNGRDDGRLV